MAVNGHGGCDDDDDARSDISNSSQDSQVEELQRLGIPLADVKTPFINKTKGSIANTQV